MKKVLLDTNAYAKLLAGSEEILEVLGNAEVVNMSTIVLGELHAGFNGGSKKRENEELLLKFLNKPTVRILSVSHETAIIFGELKYKLKRQGTPIPINDVWIAAHTFESGSLLITSDNHFQNIQGLRCR